MRVQIIGDIEGVAGIVKWAQTSGGEALYQEGRRLYTAEINAAVRGAKAAGAREIVVMDCHGADGDYMFNSLLADELDRARMRRRGRSGISAPCRRTTPAAPARSRSSSRPPTGSSSTATGAASSRSMG